MQSLWEMSKVALSFLKSSVYFTLWHRSTWTFQPGLHFGCTFQAPQGHWAGGWGPTRYVVTPGEAAEGGVLKVCAPRQRPDHLEPVHPPPQWYSSPASPSPQGCLESGRWLLAAAESL